MVSVGDTITMKPVSQVRSIMHDRCKLMGCFCKCADWKDYGVMLAPMLRSWSPFATNVWLCKPPYLAL